MMKKETTSAEPHVLTSWKEVAVYLGKGVRTVQRWERELGLPVRRPYGVEKHVIVALPEELDDWVHTRMRPRRVKTPASTPEAHILAVDAVERLQRTIRVMVERAEEMNRRCAQLLAQTELLRKGSNENRRLREERRKLRRETNIADN
jgi:hypothetical protein